MEFCGKYKAGDVVTLRIGERPPVRVEIIECLTRQRRPYYRINWEKIGWNAILNTVAIAETSLSR